MPALLLFEALLELLYQLVQPAQRFDLRLFLLAQEFLEFLAQPLLRYQRLDDVVNRFDVPEIGAERTIELVEIFLVLDQYRAAEIVERIDVGKYHPRAQRPQQVKVFADRYRDAAAAQTVKEIDQHSPYRPSGGSRAGA